MSEGLKKETIISELQYPFDPVVILKNHKKWKRFLLAEDCEWTKKKIAILGGSTFHHIKEVLELFLLSQGIKAEFYESDYARFWEEGMFENEALETFSPDIIYIFTSIHNLHFGADIGEFEKNMEDEIVKYTCLWKRLREKYQCTILQNNFEMPSYRLYGNQEHQYNNSRSSCVQKMNDVVYAEAKSNKDFLIVDLQYIAAEFGLKKWYDRNAWYLYKYPFSLEAVPLVAWNVCSIVKALCGKNKKVLALDLDNTLWGGVVAEEGVEGIEINMETPVGEAYTEFQQYISEQRQKGVILTICSKNDEEIAMEGIQKEQCVLNENDFLIKKINWKRKDENIVDIAKEVNVFPDSVVFVDDNPAERQLVSQNLPMVSVPVMDSVETYIDVLEGNHYFEVTHISSEDTNRNAMYEANQRRVELANQFESYDEYLKTLEMRAEIHEFSTQNLERIVQLIQKSNQFNLTTIRYGQKEIQQMMQDERFITLSGRLVDRFGDNGIVSLIIAEKEDDVAHIRLWLMSCRVLKRGMEYVMFDALCEQAQTCGITKLIGYYIPTAKNGSVKDFYFEMGFASVSENVWEYTIGDERKNELIQMI